MLLLVSALYTAHVIQWSLRFGRLSMDPIFDDLAYLTDGLNRLNVLETSGLRAFFNDLLHGPPHSPWSTLIASAAFAWLGIHEWAPYVFNGFLIFPLLFFIAYLIEGPPWLSAGVAALVIVLPLSFQAVLNFRPALERQSRVLVPVFGMMVLSTYYKASATRNIWQVFPDAAHGTSRTRRPRWRRPILSRLPTRNHSGLIDGCLVPICSPLCRSS